jgi:hypothetical protein
VFFLSAALPALFLLPDICVGTSKLGACAAPGLGIVEDLISAGGSVYDTATAVWTFNDITNATALGFEGNDAFSGTVMEVVQASTQYASIADTAEVRSGTGDFGFCAWSRADDRSVTGVVGKWTGGSREFRGYLNTSFLFDVRHSDNLSQTSVNATDFGNLTEGERYFFCGYHDDSADLIYASVNDVATSAAFANTPRESTNAFEVAGLLGAGYGDGLYGPVFWYKGGLPPVSDLYNSGKGMTCEEAATAGHDTNGVSCWNMTEDGGPYADSWGSNNLTGQATPTQKTPGLIITGDGDPDLYLTVVNVPVGTGGANGYAADFAVASTSCATITDSADWTWGTADGGVCFWMDSSSVVASKYLLAQTQVATHFLTTAGKVPRFTVIGETSGTSSADHTSALVDGTRYLICGSYDHSEAKASIYVNGTTTVSGSTIVGGTKDVAQNLTLGARTSTCGDGQNLSMGPVMWYKGSIPPAASLYNSGKGKTCADLAGAELTNLVSCWEMDEDGGPYDDSVGTASDLYSAEFSTNQRANGAGTFAGQRDWGFCGWFNTVSTAGYALSGGGSPYGFGMLLQATPDFQLRAYSSVPAVVGSVTTAAITSGANHAVCGWFEQTDASNGTLKISLDDGTPVTAAVSTAIADGSSFSVNALGTGTTTTNLRVGPLVYWHGAYPSAQNITDFYNSGEGVRCDGITMGQTNCWNFNEDSGGGTYTDSEGNLDLTITSTPARIAAIVPADRTACYYASECTLTGVNTPTRAAGLVERSDSGMSAATVGASSQYFYTTDASVLPQGDADFTLTFWAFTDYSALKNPVNTEQGGKLYSYSDGVGNRFLASGTKTLGGSCTVTITGLGTDPTWDLYVWGFDATSQALFSSVNGSAITSTACSDTLSEGTQLWIGRSPAVGYADTKIDNIAYFSAALTQAQVDELWASGAGLFFTADLGYWWFQERGIRFAWTPPIKTRRVVYAIH